MNKKEWIFWTAFLVVIVAVIVPMRFYIPLSYLVLSCATLALWISVIRHISTADITDMAKPVWVIVCTIFPILGPISAFVIINKSSNQGMDPTESGS